MAPRRKFIKGRKLAMKSCSKYNKDLNKNRSLAPYYLDTQTLVIQRPRKPLHLSTTDIDMSFSEDMEFEKYPVSLIAGQYQDFYKQYDSGELYQLPLKSQVKSVPTVSRSLQLAKPSTSTEGHTSTYSKRPEQSADDETPVDVVNVFRLEEQTPVIVKKARGRPRKHGGDCAGGDEDVEGHCRLDEMMTSTTDQGSSSHMQAAAHTDSSGIKLEEKAASVRGSSRARNRGAASETRKRSEPLLDEHGNQIKRKVGRPKNVEIEYLDVDSSDEGDNTKK